jgi:hypothetical protein
LGNFFEKMRPNHPGDISQKKYRSNGEISPNLEVGRAWAQAPLGLYI